MISYDVLNKDFVKAIQQDDLNHFVEKLNDFLMKDTRNFTAWLFLAKGYEALGNTQQAVNAYKYILRATDPGELAKLLIDEINNFASRHNIPELIKLASERFESGKPDTATPVRESTQQSPVTLSSIPSGSNLGRVKIIPLTKKASPGATDSRYLKTPAPSKPQGTIPARHTHTEQAAVSSETKRATPAAHEHLRRAHMALSKGDFGEALEGFISAYNLGLRKNALFLGLLQTLQRLQREPEAVPYLEEGIKAASGASRLSLINTLAQTLQRLQRYDDSIGWLETGIKVATGPSRISLLNTKSQVFQSQHNWSEAAKCYEELLGHAGSPSAKRHIQLTLVSLYRRLEKRPEAKRLIQEVLKNSPEDPIAVRIQAQLEHEVSIASELEVELPDDNIDLISPMLQRDLFTSEFRDEVIISRGGVPSVADADRLLKQAEATQSSEFGDRYPRFLEAAKAYSELPMRSYDEASYYRALTRYAMLRGGALVSNIRRQFLSGRADLQKIRRLRDSATSYFLESLFLQMQVDVKYALVSLASYLSAQVAYVRVARKEIVTEEQFNKKFDHLFSYCLDHPDDEIARIAYDSVVAWGAASSTVWNRLGTEPGGAGAIGRALEKKRRERPYRILSELTGLKFDAIQKPKEVLSKCFLERRRQIKVISNFFGGINQIPFTVVNFHELPKRWQDFPKTRSVLLETDLEILNSVADLLTILSPYNDRSPEERTSILFTARVSIENLLRFIQENPTYWGRSWFEPLLLKWQNAIRSIEQRRLIDIQPKLVASLEPPVFRPEDGHVDGGIILRNEGRGTSEGVKILVEVIDEISKKVMYANEEQISEEIKPKTGTNDSAYYHPIRVQRDALKQGLESPYRLRLRITPVFSRVEMEPTEQEFTLEVQSGQQISVGDIPWDEVNIPSEHMFKGRELFINRLLDHLLSPDRNKSFILYGLSRTGKTSILTNLQRVIDLKTFNKNAEQYRILSFMWDMGTAKGHTNASDMWGYLLEEGIVSRLEQLADCGAIDRKDIPNLRNTESVRFKDWPLLLDQLQLRRIYPVFLVDEFSFFKELVDSKRIDASFLAAVRSYAIGGKASFIFAGTYDLRKLIADPAYGVRGQLVNTNEVRVSRIDAEDAEALIKVMEPLLKFTPDAIEHIKWLSHQLPFFIQLICKQCAYFAVHTGRSIIGFPEVETVVKVLTGEISEGQWMGATQLPPGRFHSNMYMPTDPPTYTALLTTICHLTQGQTRPRLVTYPEIQQVWHRHGVEYFQAKLADAVKELTEREVLIPGRDEEEFAWRISVDLFRRWWANEHKNLELELNALKEDIK